MTLLQKAGDGDVDPDLFNAVVDALNNGDGGGFDPVGCVLFFQGNVKTEATHYFLWSSLTDNLNDGNVLTEIPARLGLDFAFDGSSAQIETTVDGTWAFTLNASSIADATFVAFITDGLFTAAYTPTAITLTGTYRLPAGATVQPNCGTTTAATGVTQTMIATLSIVRLG